jgi:hypothetical protein
MSCKNHKRDSANCNNDKRCSSTRDVNMYGWVMDPAPYIHNECLQKEPANARVGHGLKAAGNRDAGSRIDIDSALRYQDSNSCNLRRGPKGTLRFDKCAPFDGDSSAGTRGNKKS